MSAFEDAVTIARALEAGAGYAKAVISEMRHETDARLKTDRLIQGFTARELEVLKLLSNGMSTQEIASTLVLSQFTVRGHVRGVLRKLDVHSMAQAVALAFELGIIVVGTREDSVPTLVPA